MKVEKRYHGPCPCGSRRAYGICCQRWHDGEVPPDAEALMRSRYTAYVLKLEDYVLATWHPRTRPAELNLATPPRRWLDLKVLRHETGTADTAIVEFIARYKAGGRISNLRETSRFVREDDRWVYLDGDTDHY